MHPTAPNPRDSPRSHADGMLPDFHAIVAATPAGGIGINNTLPWHLPNEMRHFTHLTTHIRRGPRTQQGAVNAVVMGRRTWESIPAKYRPLSGRLNVVLTRSGVVSEDDASTAGVLVFKSLPEALFHLRDPSATLPVPSVADIYLVGGAALYTSAMHMPACRHFFLTTVHLPSEPPHARFDAVIPVISDQEGWVRCSHEELEAWVDEDVPRGLVQEKGVEYEFGMWRRRADPETNHFAEE